MTDYGRGSGSEPWHPEDPLFGDMYEPGYDSRTDPYAGGRQPQPQQPAQPQQQAGWQDPYATGQQPGYPQQGYPQQQYPQQQPQQQPYPQQVPPQQHPQSGQPQQHPQHVQQPQHPQQQGYPQAGYDGWDTGSQQTGGYGHQDPYGQQPQDPYGAPQQPDFYGQNGYPPPQQPQPQQPQYRQQPPQQAQAPGQGQGQPLGPQQGRQPLQGQQQFQQQGQGQQLGQGPAQAQQPPQQARPQEPDPEPLRTAPAETGEWEPDDEPNPREHAFFSGRDDDDEDDDSPSTPNSGGRRSGKSPAKGGKKRRSGCACMVVLLVLGGGLGGAGYFGYQFYESHFGPAPDYSGQGTGDVQVNIPQGASATSMGNILKDAGVVKSVGAFTAAANKNPKGRLIQAGVYVLHKNMSGASAVTMMLDPKSQNAMIIPEGMRAVQVFAAIDQRLGLKAGTTAKAAHAQVKKLGLPDWANTGPEIKEPLEGFLFPTRYSIAKGEKPEVLLKQMVGQAKQQYAAFDMVAEAKKEGLKTPLQLLTAASLVQAEGKTTDDFKKMSKVIYNRMVPNEQSHGLLEFDSTYNYIKNQNETKLNLDQMRALKDPYNTYHYTGLPPGPIGNPGLDALKAAMDPDGGNWYYFISVDGKETQFTETLAEFNKIKANYKP